MAKSEELPHPVKLFIVQQLACFERPSEVVKAVKAEFELVLTRQRVHYYDPTTKLGAALAPELKALFDAAREEFRKEIDRIPIANKAVQLRVLDKMLALAEGRGQIPMVIATIDAAAAIAGTIKVRHEHTGKDGGPIEVVNEARARVFRRLDDVRKRVEGRVAELAVAAGANRATE